MDVIPFMILVPLYFSTLSCNDDINIVTETTERDATDGDLYIQKLINGEVVPEKPQYLLFTAPYKLTTRGRAPPRKGDYVNLVMGFPVFIGDNKKNRRIFSTIYPKMTSIEKIFSTRPKNTYTTVVCPNVTCPRTPDPHSRSTAPYYYGLSSDTKPTFRLAYDPRRTVKEAYDTNKKPDQTTPKFIEMRESDYNM